MNSKSEKLDKYHDRHTFWAERALEQFANTSNVMFILSAGFFAYLADSFHVSETNGIKFEGYTIFGILAFSFVFLLALFALIISVITVFSRTYDIRLTRHITFIRYSVYKRFDVQISSDPIDLDYSVKSEIMAMRKYLCTDWRLIVKDYRTARSGAFTKSFEALREVNLLIGRLSWRCLNWNILFLTLSFILFIIFKYILSFCVYV